MTTNIEWLRGCATALVTPFTTNGAVDEAALQRLVEYQIAGGVELLVPCGTTGESATMTETEDQQVIKLVIDTAKGRARVIAGTGSNATAAAIEYSQTARSLGADAVLWLLPSITSRRRTVCTLTFGQWRKPLATCRSLSTTSRAYLVEHCFPNNSPARARSAEYCRGQRSIRESIANHGNTARSSRELSRAFRRRFVHISLLALGAEGLISSRQ